MFYYVDKVGDDEACRLHRYIDGVSLGLCRKKVGSILTSWVAHSAGGKAVILFERKL